MNKLLLVVLFVCILLSGCTNTLNGMREDVAKPFVIMGKVGDKIAGKSAEEIKSEE
jgi:predicted small secreted protein